MKLIAHQQIEGVDPGTTINVDAEHGQWLIDNGYASLAGGQQDQADDNGQPPNRSAPKADWVTHAQTQGLTYDEADALTKTELIDRYG